MTELSEVVHAEALRETLILRGTNEGHYICPILQLHLTLAQGNQRNKMKASNQNAKSPQGNCSVARFEMLFHTASIFLQYFRNIRKRALKRSYGVLSINSIRLRTKFRLRTGLPWPCRHRFDSEDRVGPIDRLQFLETSQRHCCEAGESACAKHEWKAMFAGDDRSRLPLMLNSRNPGHFSTCRYWTVDKMNQERRKRLGSVAERPRELGLWGAGVRSETPDRT